MRSSCLDCARKHCSAALVLEMEVKQGYPLHGWIVVGHLNEAADELITEYPALAERIRSERIEYMAGLNRCLKMNNEGEFHVEGELYDLPLIEIITDITLQHISEVEELKDQSSDD